MRIMPDCTKPAAPSSDGFGTEKPIAIPKVGIDLLWTLCRPPQPRIWGGLHQLKSTHYDNLQLEEYAQLYVRPMSNFFFRVATV